LNATKPASRKFFFRLPLVWREGWDSRQERPREEMVEYRALGSMFGVWVI
jgi:hypothetical protein